MTEPFMDVDPGRGWRWRNVQPLSVLWAAVVWVALWGDLSVANVLAGAALGVLVSVTFPLPRFRGELRPRPLAGLRLLGRFCVELVGASVQVIRVILSGREVRGSVVEVRLRSDSDLVATIVGEITSLVPGSITVDVRRSDHALFVHELDTPDEDAVQAARERTWELESRVAAALGVDLPPADRRTPSPEEDS